ncbi:alpha/beta hydrolase [Streptomyces marokkonensis]|uniref:Alpha/beta hydrolase n=1 Tax=Streptomyces marokkonensis TaxID=324855 RepID=A0ABP7PQ84_9ACTN
MRLERGDGGDLYWEGHGEGEPLVLVHGSWADRTDWAPALGAGLPESFRVFAYDRRGHGRSGAAPGPGSRRQDEDDLGAVLEEVVKEPAHVVGNSFGGSVTLGLAVRRPELFLSISVHEPPLTGIVADDPAAVELLRPTVRGIASVVEEIREGEHERAARVFVDEVALGPGTWEEMPQEDRRAVAALAETFAEEQADPDWAALDLDALGRCPLPVMLTHGTGSPPWFTTVLDRLAEALPDVRRVSIEGAGHVPHATHPEKYVAALTAFATRRWPAA